MTTLEGRVALVTGAGGGIGYATAAALGELGMDVAVHYFRNAEGANGAVAKLKELGRAAEVFEADLSQGDQGEIELGIEDLREPTDVDGTRWWDNEDDEDAVITERPPRFQQTH